MLDPVLNEGVYVYTETTQPGKLTVDYIGLFKEKEAWTVILREENAISAGLAYNFRAAWITLSAEILLDQQGVTAAFSNVLNNCGISCNVIAASRHDHIFVPYERAEEALAAIRKLEI